MYSWTPPRGYKGLRTANRQAIRVDLRPKKNGYVAWAGYRACPLALEEWCEKHCKRNWSFVDGCWWFDKTSDAVMFKLTFGGDIDS